MPGGRSSGETRLSCLRLCGPGGEETVPASGLFIFIGAAPNTDWLPDTIMRDANGFLLSGPDLKVDGKWSRAGTSAESPICWRPACREYLLPEMCATVRSSGWHPR